MRSCQGAPWPQARRRLGGRRSGAAPVRARQGAARLADLGVSGDHVPRPRGVQAFEAAPQLGGGLARRPMLRHGQRHEGVGKGHTAAAPFSRLAASFLPATGLTHLHPTSRENLRRNHGK